MESQEKVSNKVAKVWSEFNEKTQSWKVIEGNLLCEEIKGVSLKISSKTVRKTPRF